MMIALLAIRTAALFFVAAVASLTARRSSAAARRRLWVAAFVAASLMPLASLLPSFEVPWPWSDGGSAHVRADIAGSTAGALAAPTTAADSASATAENREAPVWMALAPRGSWLLVPWAAVALVLLIRHARAVAVVSRIRRAAHRFEASHRVAALAGSLPLLESPSIDVPIVAGTWRPAIILPVAARGWTVERLERVVRHELAHVQARDNAVGHLAVVLASLHWFDPLVWLGLRRFQLERERAADEAVVASGARASEYAQDLVDIVRAGPLSSVSAMASPSHLPVRIRGILASAAVGKGRTAFAFVVVAAALVSCIGAEGAEELAVRSIDGEAAVEIVFQNESAEVVDRFWVDYRGQEREYGALEPGAHAAQRTYVTHPWRLRDHETGELLGEFVAGEAPLVVVVGQDGELSISRMETTTTPEIVNVEPHRFRDPWGHGIRLSWRLPSANVAYYEVQWSDDGGQTWATYSDAHDRRQIDVHGYERCGDSFRCLPSAMPYRFRVRALDSEQRPVTAFSPAVDITSANWSAQP